MNTNRPSRRPIPILPEKRKQIRQSSVNPNLLSSFQNTEGNIDLEKIMTTGKQVMNVYNQVSPYITKFLKK
ncbi:YppG family protein [Ornithinibacillus sp. 179-J 7C1 HS]|uniref:YppG family protein n=1 Tax=Ornithinibacillus sp. 179-J 7C1 HS TaxID=3142384 RepID=UPI0039A3378B